MYTRDTPGDGLNHTDLAVLKRYAHPGALLRAGAHDYCDSPYRNPRQTRSGQVQALRTAAEQALQL